jgi:hypothetical protein
MVQRAGRIVLDEAFDVWSKKETEFGCALDWKGWDKKDLQDFIKISLVAAETAFAPATQGYYDMPSNSILK